MLKFYRLKKYLILSMFCAVTVSASCDQAIKFVDGAVKDVQGIASGNKQQFAQALVKYFDIEFLAQASLSSSDLAKFSAQHHADFKKALKERLVRTYATDNKIKTFKNLELQPINQKKCRVSGSRISLKTSFKNKSNGVETPVDWVLSGKDGGYKVVDVKIEGISQQRTLKDELKAIWRKVKSVVEDFIKEV